MEHEILLVDKPVGITSFDVIRRLRKELGIRKMGHAGTLDPLATGLLIIGVGDGTKKLREYIGLPKVYDARIVLGTKTDTGDITGKITETSPVPTLSEHTIHAVLQGLCGEVFLPVPVYSAIKQRGAPLYERARKGESVVPPVSRMYVRAADLLDLGSGFISIRFDVESGTYIRSLAEEVGRRLGTVATLGALRRISVGPYRVEDARHLG